MANTNPKDRDAVRQENIDQKVSSFDKFYSEHKTIIYSTLAAAVVIVLGALAYNKYVYQRQVAEALEQAFPAENLFQNGEYETALNGDGNNLGFADIISEYGSKAGKSMPLYAGICEYQLGNFDSAISYLKKYKGKEPILAARAKSVMGDAYVGLEDYSSALKCYKAAIAVADNIFVAGYLLKEGLVYEAMGDKANALECYNSIKSNYPSSLEAYDINKYIARVSE